MLELTICTCPGGSVRTLVTLMGFISRIDSLDPRPITLGVLIISMVLRRVHVVSLFAKQLAQQMSFTAKPAAGPESGASSKVEAGKI